MLARLPEPLLARLFGVELRHSGWASTLRRDGLLHIAGLAGLAEFEHVARTFGVIVGAEVIALREGAHSYVAKPGPVPLHTDQAQVEVIGWYCVEQDETDGASLLFDARSTIEDLSLGERVTLSQVCLACPPVVGGPPVFRFPVLRRAAGVERLFCSPWLDPARGNLQQRQALDDFRRRLSSAAKRKTIEVRLAPGEALFVDNQRVLHGRRALAPNSRRRLHRLWIIAESPSESD